MECKITMFSVDLNVEPDTFEMVMGGNFATAIGDDIQILIKTGNR